MCATSGFLQRRLYRQSREEWPYDGRYEDSSGGDEGGHRSAWQEWLWLRRPYFYRGGAALAALAAYYAYHLEEAPVTGRKRFMALSREAEEQLTRMSLQSIMQQYGGEILPASHPLTQYVERIARRIIDAMHASSPQEGEARHRPASQWRVFVIDAPIPNAFVLPGGHIFVFTGLLPIASDEGGLATVLAHEIAHDVARHGAEKMSFYQLFAVASTIVKIFVLGGGTAWPPPLGLARPAKTNGRAPLCRLSRAAL